MDFIENGIYILEHIYKEKIDIKKDKYYVINYGNKSEIIKTRYDLKRYIRKIISSDNKTISNDIPIIINLSYILDKDKLITLKEIFPNFDLFVSTYLKIMSEGIKLSIGIFDYEALLLNMVRTYIKYMKSKINDKLYHDLTDEEINLKKEIDDIEEKARKYRIVKKNEFYYETYLNSINNENEVYDSDKDILNDTIEEIEKDIESKKLELENINSKKIAIKKQERIDALNKDIVVLTLEKQKYINEKYKIKNRNKMNLVNNDKSFQEYALMSIEDYKKYLDEIKNIDFKELLKELKNKKEVLQKISDEIDDLKHNEIKLVLKYYAIDNLKSIDRKVDMRPKVLDEIIKLLEDVIKPL